MYAEGGYMVWRCPKGSTPPLIRITNDEDGLFIVRTVIIPCARAVHQTQVHQGPTPIGLGLETPHTQACTPTCQALRTQKPNL